jgi:3-methyladenine DNA glycosylase AlkC
MGKPVVKSASQAAVPPRKGAASPKDVPKDILRQLHAGELQTATLGELLAINISTLCAACVPGVPTSAWDAIDPKAGITRRLDHAAAIAGEHLGDRAIEVLAAHRSDVCRGIAGYVVGRVPRLSLKQRLSLIRPLADDLHSGVREWAWLGVRGPIAADIPAAIKHLESWTREKSPNLRRFASEVTRPRGVWCTHIQMLKDDPAMALPLLEPLHSDPHKYVQDSVANWLNDASKHQAKWVRDLCRRWGKQSKSPQTARICKRALRTVGA